MMGDLDDSEDEVFFGELSLKEVKRSIGVAIKQRRTFCTTYTKTASEDEVNKSIKIIETHSTPNIISEYRSNAEPSNLKCLSNPCFFDSQCTDNSNSTMSVISVNEHMEPLSYQNVTNDSILTNLDFHQPDDSFLQIEKLVNDISGLKPDEMNDNKKEELDNTLDVIEYILNNGPSNDSDIKHTDNKSMLKEKELKQSHLEKKSHFEYIEAKETNTFKPQSALKTPTNERKLRTPTLKTTFKTPGNPVSHKKQILTPLKKQFEHVVSPVASYINDSPVVPLLKNVRPKKPLNGTSFIPQPIKNPSKINVFNKENQNLPSTAYRCAKERKVIDFPDEHRLPQSQWAKHVASSLQKGIVMKHIHRENCSTKKPLFQQQEDSFSNLTLQQADLSVCTQKSAVRKDI